MQFIFRGDVLLYQIHDPRQFDNEWAACLANEGGVEADFDLIEDPDPIPTGMVAVRNGGSVRYIENPKRIAKAAAKAAARSEIKGLLPSLSDETLKLLGF